MKDNVEAPKQYVDQAVVYLANSQTVERASRPQCPSIYDSIASLRVHMPTDWSKTAIFILSEAGGLTDEQKGKIQSAAPGVTQFHEVAFVDPYSDQFKDRFWKWEDGRDATSYVHMCAFWTRGFFKLPFLPDLVMRMDTDSCIKSHMPEDPFELMRAQALSYMYHSPMVEGAPYIDGLYDFMMEHHVNQMFKKVWADHGTNGSINVISTNLEWFHLPSFRQPAIENWIEKIREVGGNYLHRWGDAPIRRLEVNQFFEASQVRRFCKFEYGHSSWPPFKACDDAAVLQLHGQVHAESMRPQDVNQAWLGIDLMSLFDDSYDLLTTE